MRKPIQGRWVQLIPPEPGLLREGVRRSQQGLHRDHGRDDSKVVRPSRAALVQQVVTPDLLPRSSLVIDFGLNVGRGGVPTDLGFNGPDLHLRKPLQIILVPNLIAVAFVDGRLRQPCGNSGAF